MSDLDALLRAVILDPDDDLPRLVMADSLDEAGDTGRAEFIRVQVKVAGWMTRYPDADAETLESILHTWERYYTLMEVAHHWLPPAVRDAGRGFSMRNDAEYQGQTEDSSVPMRVHFTRGFASGVTTWPTQFFRHAADLFATHPIRSVWLSNRVPFHASDSLGAGWGWRRVWSLAGRNNVPHAIPGRLADFLPPAPIVCRGGIRDRYPTRQAALDALNSACVAYGRHAAGNPALTVCG